MKQTDVDERKPSMLSGKFGRLLAKLEANPVLTMIVIAVVLLGALLMGPLRENGQQTQINRQQAQISAQQDRIDSLQMWVTADLASKSTLRAYAPASALCVPPLYVDHYNDIPYYDAPQPARCDIQHLRFGVRAYVDRASVTMDHNAQFWVLPNTEVTGMPRSGSIVVMRTATGYRAKVGLSYEEAGLRFRIAEFNPGRVQLIDTP